MIDQRFTPKMAASSKAANCPAVSPKTSISNSNLVRGFLLSREVMECTEPTLHDYRSRLGQFAKFTESQFPELALVAVSRQHIEAYLIWLKDNGRVSWTLRTNYRILKAFYNWMVEEELVDISPLLRIKPPRVPKLGKPFIKAEQRDLLLSAHASQHFTSLRTAAMIWLLWGTGMRLSELAGLEISDLDWNWGPKKCGRIRVLGKGRRERYIEFTKEAKRAVWRYLARRNDNLPQLWVSSRGVPMRADGIGKSIARAYQHAGFKVKDTCHVFRRTWARRKIEEGIPQKYILLTGGWEDAKTLDGYINAMTSEEALRAMQH